MPAKSLAKYDASMQTANPGTKIVAKIVFPTSDIKGAAVFYRTLGFGVDIYEGNYAWVTNGGEETLHLAEVDDLDRSANRAAGYLHVQDAADWHMAWAAAGAELSPLVDQPWGMREFSLRDPDGNFLRVGQNL